MSRSFDDELREILIRVDERTESIDARLQRIEDDVDYIERDLTDKIADVNLRVDEVDNRVRRNTVILSGMTLGLSTILGAIITKLTDFLDVMK
jgi:hypothetical protein